LPTDSEIKAAFDCLGSLSSIELRKRIIQYHGDLFEKLMETACLDPDDEKIELEEPDQINKEDTKRLWGSGKKVKDLSAGADLFDDNDKIERSDD
jgi:hypothetical protein